MAYDKDLYLHDPAVSAGLFVGDSSAIEGSIYTKKLTLPGTPLRGLNLNIVLPSVANTPSLEVCLLEGVSADADHKLFRQYPVAITAVGEYDMRFHLDKGYKSIQAKLTLTGSDGAGFPGAIIRIGQDGGMQD